MTSGDGIHVVFGTGALGQAVMRALVERGHRVRMVSRSARFQAPEGVEVAKGDATDPESTKRVCSDAAVIYHCAAPAYTRWATDYPPIQAGIIAAAASSGALLVSAESVYHYGAIATPMREDSPINPCSRKGRVRVQLSEMLFEAQKRGDIQMVIGRAPDFYGPGGEDTTIYGTTVFGAMLAGKIVRVFGKLDLLHTFIFVDDFGRGLATLGQHPEGAGQVWHLPSPPALTQRQMLAIIANELGVQPKLQETPAWLPRVLGPFIPIMRELDEMQYQWQRPYLFDATRFVNAYGSELTPHEEGVRKTAAWYRQNRESAP